MVWDERVQVLGTFTPRLVPSMYKQEANTLEGCGVRFQVRSRPTVAELPVNVGESFIAETAEQSLLWVSVQQ